MKLYLSSFRVPTPKELTALLRRPVKDAKAAIIVNAKDFKENKAEREFKLNQLKDHLYDIGFKVTFVDLKDYITAKEVEAALASYDLIWAAGGNTFVLMHEIVRCGFDKAIKNLLEQGVVYGGESAGAIVAGTSFKGIELADDPDEASRVIWEGIGLVDRIIVPHADNSEFEYFINRIVSLHHNSKKLAILKDNQALVVIDDEVRLTQG